VVRATDLLKIGITKSACALAANTELAKSGEYPGKKERLVYDLEIGKVEITLNGTTIERLPEIVRKKSPICEGIKGRVKITKR